MKEFVFKLEDNRVVLKEKATTLSAYKIAEGLCNTYQQEISAESKSVKFKTSKTDE